MLYFIKRRLPKSVPIFWNKRWTGEHMDPTRFILAEKLNRREELNNYETYDKILMITKIFGSTPTKRLGDQLLTRPD